MAPLSGIAKFAWVTGAIFVNLAKLPLLFLYFAPRQNRPDPRWTVFQSVMNSLMNAFLYHAAVVEMKTPLDLEPGSLGDRVMSVPPGPPSIFKGVTSVDASPSVRPAPTGGIWFPNAFTPNDQPSSSLGDNKPVILHFHAGGYVIGDVRMDQRFGAKLLTERVGSSAFLSLYRLASNPGGGFPAALQDALSAYHHLVNTLGLAPERIVLSGDSAGGHIALCLLRYLVDHDADPDVLVLPPPRAALLWSPALDLLTARDAAALRQTGRYFPLGRDYLEPAFLAWGATKLTGSGRDFVLGAADESVTAATTPYLSFLGRPFRSPCPLWVFCGGNEAFAPDVECFVGEMRSVPGNSVTLRTEPAANHDIFATGNIMGWQAEAEAAADEAGRWVAGLGE